MDKVMITEAYQAEEPDRRLNGVLAFDSVHIKDVIEQEQSLRRGFGSTSILLNHEEKEYLTLMDEESIYLMRKGLLMVYTDIDQSPVEIDTMWSIFCKARENFASKYKVYEHFKELG
jgi:tRNA splicing endonuclease